MLLHLSHGHIVIDHQMKQSIASMIISTLLPVNLSKTLLFLARGSCSDHGAEFLAPPKFGYGLDDGILKN